jgi:hypothetical protein
LVRAGGASTLKPKVVGQGFDGSVIRIGVGWCSQSGRHFDFLCCRLSGHDDPFLLFLEERDPNRGGMAPRGSATMDNAAHRCSSRQEEAALFFGVLFL